jgi:hypothetical protein
MNAPLLPLNIELCGPPVALELIVNDSSNKLPASILRTLPFESVYVINPRFDIEPDALIYVHENFFDPIERFLVYLIKHQNNGKADEEQVERKLWMHREISECKVNFVVAFYSSLSRWSEQ